MFLGILTLCLGLECQEFEKEFPTLLACVQEANFIVADALKSGLFDAATAVCNPIKVDT